MKVPSRLSRTEAPKRPAGEKPAAKAGAPAKAQAAAQAESVRQVQQNADAGGAGPGGGGQEGVSENEADPIWGGHQKAAAGKGRLGGDARALPTSMSPRDAFAAQAALAKAASTRQTRESLGAEVSQQLPPSRSDGQDPFSALNRAQEPGVYFKEDEDGGNGGRRNDGESAVDPELEEALEETLQLLFGVSGIHRVSPGTDDTGAPVVLIFATRGFGAPSMARIPEEVRGFKTLLVLPYQLLPLRRLL